MVLENFLRTLGNLNLLFRLASAFFALRITLRFLAPKSGKWRLVLLYVIHFVTSSAVIYAGVGDFIPPLLLSLLFTGGVAVLCEGRLLARVSLGLLLVLLPISLNAVLASLRPPFDQFFFALIAAFWAVLLLAVSRAMPQNSRPTLRSRKLWFLIDLLSLMPLGASFAALALTQPIPLGLNLDPFREPLLVQNERVLLIVLSLSVIATLVILAAVMVLSHHEKLVEEQTLWQIRRQYYENLDESQKQVRRLRHDMANHLTVLASLEDTAMRQYLEQLACSPAMQSGQRYCENPVVNAVLSAKSSMMEEAQIQTELAISLGIQTPLSDVDLCALFANGLDNAIEASVKLPIPQRKIELRAAIDKGFFVLKLSNAMEGDILMQEGQIATSKKDKQLHGYGLAALRDIAERHKGSLHIEHEKNEFGLLVIIPC